MATKSTNKMQKILTVLNVGQNAEKC